MNPTLDTHCLFPYATGPALARRSLVLFLRLLP
jgi:hypothetical protein